MPRTLLSALLLLFVAIVLSRNAAWLPLVNEAFAYHPNRSGSASIGAVLPIAVGAVLVVAGVVFWGRKKRKTKSKRRKRRN
jgi:hypothetical protein